MEKIPRLNQDQRSNLVAYLDGELPEPAAKEIEQVLSKSPTVQHDVRCCRGRGTCSTVAAVGRQQRSDGPNAERRQSRRGTQALVACDLDGPHSERAATPLGVIVASWLAAPTLAAFGGFVVTSLGSFPTRRMSCCEICPSSRASFVLERRVDRVPAGAGQANWLLR